MHSHYGNSMYYVTYVLLYHSIHALGRKSLALTRYPKICIMFPLLDFGIFRKTPDQRWCRHRVIVVVIGLAEVERHFHHVPCAGATPCKAIIGCHLDIVKASYYVAGFNH